METDQSQKRAKNYVIMRSVMDLGMGLVILGFGVFLLVASKFGIEFNIDPPFFKYFFAGMCIVYGSWRMYRGIQKNYYSE